ncbi:MAG: DUF6941 family protein, partial [Luteolibacter sp.]
MDCVVSGCLNDRQQSPIMQPDFLRNVSIWHPGSSNAERIMTMGLGFLLLGHGSLRFAPNFLWFRLYGSAIRRQEKGASCIDSRARALDSTQISMDIQIATLCDHAADYNGKLVITGTFDTLAARALPVV